MGPSITGCVSVLLRLLRRVVRCVLVVAGRSFRVSLGTWATMMLIVRGIAVLSIGRVIARRLGAGSVPGRGGGERVRY